MSIVKARPAQTLTLITEDLEIISPSEVVKDSNGYTLMYVVDDDGLERVALGSSIKPYVGDHKIEKFTKCKNGKKGWVEFYNSENKKQKIKGDIILYLCVKFESGSKPPKVKTYVSDLEI